jgi:aspartate/methionine/tyrosine aminotransferase
MAFDIFSKIPQLTVNRANGAFYMTVLFNKGVLRDGQSLKPKNSQAAEIIKPLLKTDKLDKQFVYHLLASRGICVVPLSSGFNSDLYGFRTTLLEQDMEKFREIMNTIAGAVGEYIVS